MLGSLLPLPPRGESGRVASCGIAAALWPGSSHGSSAARCRFQARCCASSGATVSANARADRLNSTLPSGDAASAPEPSMPPLPHARAAASAELSGAVAAPSPLPAPLPAAAAGLWCASRWPDCSSAASAAADASSGAVTTACMTCSSSLRLHTCKEVVTVLRAPIFCCAGSLSG